MNDTSTASDLLEPLLEEKPRIRGVARAAVYFALAALAASLVKSLVFFLYVNSGGLNRIADRMWPLVFGIYPLTWLIAIALVISSLVMIPFSEHKRKRLILTVLGLFLIMCSWSIDSYTTFGFSWDRTRTDDLRYIAHNMLAREVIYSLRDGIPEYCREHQGHLPPQQNWYDSLTSVEPNVSSDLRPYAIARLKDSHRFAYNKHVAGASLKDLGDDVVLIFEAEQSDSQVGARELISAKHHYGRGSLVLFADMHVEFVKVRDFDKLQWKP